MTESEISTELLAAVKAGPLPLAQWAGNNTTRIRYVVRRGVSALSYEKAERALNSVILELDNAVADTDRYARAGRFRDAWHAWRRTDDPLIALDSKFINWPGRAEAIERARNVFQAHKRILEPQFPPSAWEVHKERSESKAEAKDEETILQEIADEAMREARRATIDGGDIGPKGQLHAATIVRDARVNIRDLVARLGASGGRRHDLLLVDDRLQREFKELIAACDAEAVDRAYRDMAPLDGHGDLSERFFAAKALYEAVKRKAADTSVPLVQSSSVDVPGMLKMGFYYFDHRNMANLESAINVMLEDVRYWANEVAKHKEPEKPVQKAAETEWWTSHGYNKTGMYDMFIHQDYDYIKREPVFEVGRDSGGYWNVLAKASNMEDAQRIAEKILYDEFQAKLKRLKQDIAACKRRDQMQAVARLSAEAEAVEAKMKSVAPQKAKRRTR